MTKRALEARLSLWQNRLGLDAWEVELDWDTSATDGCTASIRPSTDYDSATLCLSPKWRSWSSSLADRTLVHELMHLLLRDLEQVIDRVEGHVHRDVLSVVKETHYHFLEQAVERLALRFVELSG